MKSLCDEMQLTLLQTRDILEANGQSRWAQAMHDLMCDWKEAQDADERSNVARRLLRMFRGMGSFNDIVFHFDGKVLSNETGLLHALQNDLHRLAVEFLR